MQYKALENKWLSQKICKVFYLSLIEVQGDWKFVVSVFPLIKMSPSEYLPAPKCCLSYTRVLRNCVGISP